MSRFLIYFSFMLILLAAPQLTHAQASADDATKVRVLPADRAGRVALRQPTAARLRELRSSREFQYVEVKSERSSWDLFWVRFWRWLDELLDTPSGRVAWDYGFYALMVVALVFAVLKLMQVDLTRAFGRSQRPAPLSYDATTEDIHTIDFNTLLRQAEDGGNYRLAVRLGYLEVLKQLTDRGLIHWQPDKTNHDYLFELPDGPLPPAFRELTRQFDYVWYGEADDLTPDLYQQARATRQAFQQLLQSTSRRAA